MPATYEPIASTTLGASAAAIEFTSIPGTYTDLVVVLQGQPQPLGQAPRNCTSVSMATRGATTVQPK